MRWLMGSCTRNGLNTGVRCAGCEHEGGASRTRTVGGATVGALVEVVAGQKHRAEHRHEVGAAAQRRARRLQRAKLLADLQSANP